MALLVNYEGLKFWGAQFKAEERNEADQLGHVLIAVGLSEISKKTISELLFRVRFLDFTWGNPFLNGDPSDKELIQLFKKYIGLKIVITNRGLKDISTRRKFMVNQLSNIEEKIMKQINN